MFPIKQEDSSSEQCGGWGFGGGPSVEEVVMKRMALSIIELRGTERMRWSSFLNIDLHRSKKSTFLNLKKWRRENGQDFDDERRTVEGSGR